MRRGGRTRSTARTPGKAGQWPQARAGRPGTACEHCGQTLTLDDVLFIEDGTYVSYQLKAKRRSLDFDIHEIGSAADTYFTCRDCGGILKEITDFWWSDGEEAVLKALRNRREGE